MLNRGAAKKVTIYVNEDAQYHLQPLYEAILNYLLHKGVAGATASRAMAGFGPHRVMHTPKIEALGEHLPIRIEFVETADKVDAVLPTLFDMVTDGLIEVQDTTIVKSAMKERPAAAKRPRVRHQGKAKLMRIFLGEADQWHGEPLYEAIVKQLRMMEIAGATVYRGILGYGAKGHPHKGGFFPISRDLPLMVAVIDSEDKLNQARDTIESMIEDGLIVMSDVDIIRLVHGPESTDISVGPTVRFSSVQRFADSQQPDGPPAQLQPTRPAKLLRLHFSEHDKYHGRSLREAIVEKCRELSVAGATVFRGLEGFGESAEIHRAHLFVHDQPIVVMIIDSAENISRLMPVLEEMIDTGLMAVSDVEIRRITR